MDLKDVMADLSAVAVAEFRQLADSLTPLDPPRVALIRDSVTLHLVTMLRKLEGVRDDLKESNHE